MRVSGLFLACLCFSAMLGLACEDDDCHEHALTVQLSGQIAYEDYESGPIRIYVCEDDSSRCGGSAWTPGDCVAETELDGPGEFSIAGQIRWMGDDPPLVYLDAYNDADSDGKYCEQGDAGRYEYLEAGDYDDLVLELDTESCNPRL